MGTFRRIAWAAATALVAAQASLPLAQSPSVSPASPSSYPPPIPRRKGPSLPLLAFRVVAEIPLPGPLPGAAPQLSEGTVRIPVAGGVAVTVPAEGQEARIEPAAPDGTSPDPEAPSPWVVREDGRRRFRTLPEGRVVAEKLGAVRKKWRGTWSLRVAGETPSPPLLLGRRLFFATRNDQVIAVGSDNGHRLWAVDVGDRVSRPLELWSGTLPEAAGRTDLLLVTPDGGASLIALDPYDGTRVAVFELPASEGRLATGARATPDGRVVLGREKYATADASLLVLGLVPATEPAAAAREGYDTVGAAVPGLH